MVYSADMTENIISPSEEEICSLVDRLRATGHHLNEETNVIEGRVPNFHDCHVAADVIESLLIFKKMAEFTLARMIEEVIIDE